MSDSEKIICKPTPWFLIRVAVMIALFGVFTFLFYKDGSTGYRQKNAAFYLRKTFEQASAEWSDKSSRGTTPEEWAKSTRDRTVNLPDDASYVLPPEVQPGMKWPEILQDAEKLRSGDWNSLWKDFSRDWGKSHSWNMDAETEKEPYTARKIHEQWVVMWISLALVAVALFFLIRTSRRSISADDEAIFTQTGKRVPFADLKRLDLRKWETKGLAFADFEGPSGTGRIRIDGLTYGGFKLEQGEPAERLMRRVRSHFSGELIEYVTTAPGEVDSSAPTE